MGGTYLGRRLYAGGKYSDLTITCNFRQWAVHRAIVCSRSGFFDGACSNAFVEANSGVIDLSEDDEEAVEQMIRCTNDLFNDDCHGRADAVVLQTSITWTIAMSLTNDDQRFSDIAQSRTPAEGSQRSLT